MQLDRPSLRKLVTQPRVRNALLVAALALIVMLPAVGHDFINWDDNRLILENKAVTSTGGIATIWSSLELPRGFPNYPLTMSMYWLEHQLWGLHPAGYHAINIVLHVINAVLVLALLRRIGLGELPATLAAALFAAHPMQVESVAWVSERKNVLFTMFSLVTMLAYLKYIGAGHRRAWWAALLAFVAALLSKTAAVTVPCTLLATVWLKRERMTTRDVVNLVPFFALALVAGALTTGVEAPPRTFLSFSERPLLAVNTLSFYLARLVFPLVVVPVHPKWNFEAGGVFLIAPIALIIVLGLLFRYRRTLPKLAWWGIAHFLVSLGPFLGLISFGYHETSYVADRYVYFASFGLFAPVAAGIVHLLSRFQRNTVLMTSGGYVAVMALVTLFYVPVWKDSRTLWTYTLKHNPNCASAHNNLAAVLEADGEVELAMAHYRYVMEIDPHHAAAPANYAAALARLGDLDGAERYYMRSLSIGPRNGLAHLRLACVHVQQNRFEDALVHLRIADRLEPNNPEILSMAGFAHEHLGHFDKAEMLYAQTLELQPDHVMASHRLPIVRAKAREVVANADSQQNEP